ncbi:MAG: SDR family oxidoreductase [Reichenbachiella sp.]|uniref:SDR family oxidoreductase n=1 Tax=Reichenbachiella sp. TaxID=2184521 RepID=UPI0032973AC5
MTSISILGCGWLGLPLGKHLAEAGYQIKGSTTQVDKIPQLESAGIKPFHLALNPKLIGDVSDFFDSDILLINLPPRNRDGIQDFHETQLQTLLEHIISKYVIFVSSTAVYPSNNQVVTEVDANSECLTRGGISLLNMEQLFANNPAFQTTVIRFGGLYGPDRHPGRFLSGKKNLAGADNPINMIHLEDSIGVIQSIIENELWGEVFNACAPMNETRQSFYEKAARELGVEAPTFSGEPLPFKKVSSEKLLKRTGYKFQY